MELISRIENVCTVVLIEPRPEGTSICCSLGTQHLGVIVMRRGWRYTAQDLQVDVCDPLVNHLKIIVLFIHFGK